MTARRSLPDVPDGFQGCARPCWNGELKHTYAWGSCEKASEPPRKDPEIGWWRSFPNPDGYSFGIATIPFPVVFPWARYLPMDERHQMMEELADAAEPERVLKAWRVTAMTWADPMALDVLTRGHDHGDYVDAPRPKDEELTTGQIAKLLGVSRPTVVRLLDGGKIASTQINVVRKAKRSDVLAYRDGRIRTVQEE